VSLIQDGSCGSHLGFGFRQLSREQMDGLISVKCFMGWAQLEEGGFDN
jgi:hypothetical protein